MPKFLFLSLCKSVQFIGHSLIRHFIALFHKAWSPNYPCSYTQESSCLLSKSSEAWLGASTCDFKCSVSSRCSAHSTLLLHTAWICIFIYNADSKKRNFKHSRNSYHLQSSFAFSPTDVSLQVPVSSCDSMPISALCPAAAHSPSPSCFTLSCFSVIFPFH